MSEREMMRALARGEDVDTVVAKEMLRYMVQRQITCPQSGRVLDIRRAVAVEVTMPDGKVRTAAYDAEWFDSVRHMVEVGMEADHCKLVVHDGRILFGRSKKKNA